MFVTVAEPRWVRRSWLRSLLQSCLGGGQAGDRHAERRAADVVQAHLVAERDRGGIATVFATDADLQALAWSSGPFRRPSRPTGRRRVVSSDWNGSTGRISCFRVVRQEGVDVVAAVAERHLRQVVGAKAEEVGVLGDFVGRQSGTRDLDHRADQDVQLAGVLLGCLDLVDGLFGQRSQAAPVRRPCRPAGS